MKNLSFLFAFIFAVNTGFAGISQYDDVYFSNPTPVTFNIEDEQAAVTIIAAIVDEVGLKQNFEIQRGDVKNALAKIKDRKRYIFYNPAFIKRIQNASKTDWSAIGILAHEVGHHLNGHTILGSGSQPRLELEADEFSGFVLRKMGASLKESQAAMYQLNNKKASKTHPCRVDRLAAIERGWRKADQQERKKMKSWFLGKQKKNKFSDMTK